MSKLNNMRVIEIPKFRAVSSGPRALDEIFGTDGFAEWCSAHPQLFPKTLYEPTDLLWHENCDIDQTVLICAIRDEVTKADVSPWQIVEFPGGMYLVATADETDPDDVNETVSGMYRWIDASDVFQRGDFPASGMCNMPNANGVIDKAHGIAQQQIFLPIKFK